jgi:hypothetical protein
MMWRYGETIGKLLLLLVLWPVLMVIVHLLARDSLHTPTLTLIFGAVAGIAGLYVSDRIIRWHGDLSELAVEPRKTKNIEPEGLRLRDMISLLDEDDLDDLRAEVRETLRERIHRLSADETETFEALLSDSKRKRR